MAYYNNYMCPCGRDADVGVEGSSSRNSEVSGVVCPPDLFSPHSWSTIPKIRESPRGKHLDPDSQKYWTKFCVVCDGIQVPWTDTGRSQSQPYDFGYSPHEQNNPYLTYAEQFQTRLLFKEVMGLPGDKKVDLVELRKARERSGPILLPKDLPIRPYTPEQDIGDILKLYKYLNY
jgi:hypothetical protein